MTEEQCLALDLSGKIDKEEGDPEVRDLNVGLFLFALRKVQQAKSLEELQRTWEQYRPWWIKRLPEPAYFYVKVTVAKLAKEAIDVESAAVMEQCAISPGEQLNMAGGGCLQAQTPEES